MFFIANLLQKMLAHLMSFRSPVELPSVPSSDLLTLPGTAGGASRRPWRARCDAPRCAGVAPPRARRRRGWEAIARPEDRRGHLKTRGPRHGRLARGGSAREVSPACPPAAAVGASRSSRASARAPLRGASARTPCCLAAAPGTPIAQKMRRVARRPSRTPRCARVGPPASRICSACGAGTSRRTTRGRVLRAGCSSASPRRAAPASGRARSRVSWRTTRWTARTPRS